MKCPLCDYEADGINSMEKDEIIGHLLVDHGLPPNICVDLANNIEEDGDDLPV